jgi:hypothetical protein
MYFSTADDICQFIIDSIGEENLGGYKIWHDSDSFSIKTDLLSIFVHYSYHKRDPYITFLSIRSRGNIELYSRFNDNQLSFLQAHPNNKLGKKQYKDRLEFRINEWFFSFVGLALEGLFDP